MFLKRFPWLDWDSIIVPERIYESKTIMNRGTSERTCSWLPTNGPLHDGLEHQAVSDLYSTSAGSHSVWGRIGYQYVLASAAALGSYMYRRSEPMKNRDFKSRVCPESVGVPGVGKEELA